MLWFSHTIAPTSGHCIAGVSGRSRPLRIQHEDTHAGAVNRLPAVSFSRCHCMYSSLRPTRQSSAGSPQPYRRAGRRAHRQHARGIRRVSEGRKRALGEGRQRLGRESRVPGKRVHLIQLQLGACRTCVRQTPYAKPAAQNGSKIDNESPQLRRKWAC